MYKSNEEKLNAIRRMYFHSSDFIGVEPISEKDKEIENHPNGYSWCDGCAQWFHNENVMCVDDVGMHFCYACLYSIVTLYISPKN